MRVFLATLTKSFLNQMAYRSEVWLRIVGNMIALFIQISIWRAIMGNHIAMDLIKPVSYPLILFANELGIAVFRFIFTMIPSVVIAGLFFGLTPPHSGYYMVSFVITLIIALFISFAIGYLIALVAFWFLTTFALEWTVMALITVFSGSFLPIWFFTPSWAAFANMLPFKYLGFVPAAMYMGKIPESEIIHSILVGLVWVLILFGLTKFLWWRAVKRLVIQGG